MSEAVKAKLQESEVIKNSETSDEQENDPKNTDVASSKDNSAEHQLLSVDVKNVESVYESLNGFSQRVLNDALLKAVAARKRVLFDIESDGAKKTAQWTNFHIIPPGTRLYHTSQSVTYELPPLRRDGDVIESIDTVKLPWLKFSDKNKDEDVPLPSGAPPPETPEKGITSSESSEAESERPSDQPLSSEDIMNGPYILSRIEFYLWKAPHFRRENNDRAYYEVHFVCHSLQSANLTTTTHPVIVLVRLVKIVEHDPTCDLRETMEQMLQSELPEGAFWPDFLKEMGEEVYVVNRPTSTDIPLYPHKEVYYYHSTTVRTVSGSLLARYQMMDANLKLFKIAQLEAK